MIMQQKTHRPVQFEITEQTRESLGAWISYAQLKSDQYLFPSRIHSSPHLSTRQYARIVDNWVKSIGLDPAAYGTHTMRRTKATLVYRKTKNLRAVQLLLGHTKLETGYPDKCGDASIHGCQTQHCRPDRKRARTTPRITPISSAGFLMMLLVSITWIGCAGRPVFPALTVLAAQGGD
jgi:hypothetical protein